MSNTLTWKYGKRHLDISMPGYIDKVRKRFKHELPKKPQHSPYQPQPKKYGTASQDPIDPDMTDPINDTQKTRIQQVVGMILYYARAIDLTLLPGLSGIASEQATATEATETRELQLLDYVSTHPHAVVRYYASDMI